VEDGYLEITGTRVQPGAFISAANLSINAQRIESISGEFQVLGATAEETQANSAAFLAKLRGDLGDQFVESEAQDNLQVQAHIDAGMDIMQVIIIVAAIVISIYTAGAASAALAGAVQAGTISSAVATGLSAAAGSMASSAFTGLVNGDFSIENVIKAGIISGLTAGLTAGIGQAIGNETMAGGEFVNGKWVATDGVTSLSDKLVGYTLRAGISSGVNQVANGDAAGSFTTNFISSWVNSAAADGANWIGDNTATGSLENIAAHALLGCVAAAATDKDCASGAAGGAVAATFNPILDNFTSTDELLRKAELAGLSALVTGVIADAADLDVQTAIDADQNETLNNYLTKDEILDKKREMATCTTDTCRQGVEAKWAKTWNENLNAAIADDSVMAVAKLESTREGLQALLAGECRLPATCHTDVKNSIESLDNLIAGKPLQKDGFEALERIGVVLDAVGASALLKSGVKQIGRKVSGWLAKEGSDVAGHVVVSESAQTVRTLSSEAIAGLRTEGVPSEVIDSLRLAREQGYDANIVVIGRKADTTAFKAKPDHEVLDVPEWNESLNNTWTSVAIARKAPVRLASSVTDNMWDPIRNRPTVFALEYQQLVNAGYKRVGDYLLPPGK
jgi:hypothetical protein